MSKEAGITQLKALDRAEGIYVGSTMIDNEARKILEQRLKSRHIDAPYGITHLAESMMDQAFEFYKRNFGKEGGLMDFCAPIPTRDSQWVTLKQ